MIDPAMDSDSTSETAQQLRQLLIKRRQIKGSLTRFITYLENFDKSEIIQLEARLEQATGLLDNFNTVQDEIEILSETELSSSEPVTQWSTLLIYLITKKLDPSSEKSWEEHVISRQIESPGIDDLIKFLNARCQLLEAISREKSDKSTGRAQNTSVNHKKPVSLNRTFSGAAIEASCVYCNGQHAIYLCDKFKALPAASLRQEIQKLKLCWNCLRQGHQKGECRSRGCKRCGARHNTLLHESSHHNAVPASTSSATGSALLASSESAATSGVAIAKGSSSAVQKNDDQSTGLLAGSCVDLKNRVLLSTAIILLKDAEGRWHECRALLDSGSQPNFITKRTVELLKLKPMNSRIPVLGVGSSVPKACQVVSTEIRSTCTTFSTKQTLLVLEKITENQPSVSFAPENLRIPSSVQLADPRYHKSSEINVLLGAGLYLELLCSGQIQLGPGLPVLHNTVLGWIISGKLEQEQSDSTVVCNLAVSTRLESQIEKFWLVEEVSRHKTEIPEHDECETLFRKTTRRDERGHFVVTLPIKNNRIVWRENTSEDIAHYKLNTITYGTASASFLAVRCLQQVGQDNLEKYPKTSKVILNDFYVDDLISGSDSVDDAKQLKNELAAILDSYGFPLRKWLSNRVETLEQTVNNESNTFQLNNDETRKTLGVFWNAQSDVFKYTVEIDQFVLKRITKRGMLSAISKIFDPLGILSPVTVTVKLMIQELWQLKAGWDDIVTPKVSKGWTKFISELSSIQEIETPRQIIMTNATRIEIHAFCDSSQRAYGANLYVKSTGPQGSTVNLLCSRSRVAPLKAISLPRLELCGALLMVRLVSRVMQTIDTHINQIFYWTDSTIVLSWISAPPIKWKQFVANRVTEIQNVSNITQWNHISSQDNPADIVSRGLRAPELATCELWWHGPSWLAEDEQSWPRPSFKTASNIENSVLEARKWSKEYLQLLQVRTKWLKADTQEIHEGKLVLLLDDNLPPMLWKLGRITKLHHGQDGVARTVTVRTVNGETTRAVQRVALLPVEDFPKNSVESPAHQDLSRPPDEEEIFTVSPNIRKYLEVIMARQKTDILYVNNKLGLVDIRRGIFQATAARHSTVTRKQSAATNHWNRQTVPSESLKPAKITTAEAGTTKPDTSKSARATITKKVFPESIT
ncbi:unnamed protein product [Acanthoscelides obtectus]|uniref:CCHC-type domain-containing protein n=1 Tax=Acanthoscelides obtectus TaxID=200917 RepID=A0A9P0JYY0_ACAOB|nr:unnamed protein product [Acanthoscelides obtectus]CAK1654096.1 hypothetical protein AOBTE_LOCUS18450 [Acanthoscelides obtectus]